MLYDKVKALQNDHVIHSLWTNDGKIFCKRSPSPKSRAIIIRSEQDIEEKLIKHVDYDYHNGE